MSYSLNTFAAHEVGGGGSINTRVSLVSRARPLILAMRGKGGLVTPCTGSSTKQKNVARPIRSRRFELAYVINRISRNRRSKMSAHGQPPPLRKLIMGLVMDAAMWVWSLTTTYHICTCTSSAARSNFCVYTYNGHGIFFREECGHKATCLCKEHHISLL